MVNNPQKIDIQSAKKPKSLPVVLSRNEIERILESPKNAKHKLLLSLAYGAGLRVSKVIALKAQDLDCEELTVYIKQAKGQKDRISVMPESLANDLKNAFKIAEKYHAEALCAEATSYDFAKSDIWRRGRDSSARGGSSARGRSASGGTSGRNPRYSHPYTRLAGV